MSETVRYRVVEETRARLLSASREAFAALGYVGTRVDDIVERAGLSHGTFYRYFRDKEDALIRLAEDVGRALYGAAIGPLGRPPDDPLDAVRQRLSAFFDAYTKEWDVARVWMQADGVHYSVHEVRNRVRQSIVGGIGDLIAHDAEKGLTRPGIDPQVAAGAFVAMAEGFANQQLVAGRSVNEAQIDELAGYWVRAIYAAQAEIPPGR